MSPNKSEKGQTRPKVGRPPKKGGYGGGRTGAGRPPDKGIQTNAKGLDEEDRASYWRVAKAKSCKQANQPQAKGISKAKVRVKLSRGRPPISPLGSMDDDMLREARRMAAKKWRLKVKRQWAISQRRDKQLGVRKEMVLVENESSDGEEGVEEQDGVEEEQQESHGNVGGDEEIEDLRYEERIEEERQRRSENNDTDDNMESENNKNMYVINLEERDVSAEATDQKIRSAVIKEYKNLEQKWKRNIARVRELLYQYNEVEQVDAVVKLLSDLSKFDPQKLGITINVDKAKMYLKKGLSKLSPFKIRMISSSILDTLLQADDKELLLEWLVKDLVKTPLQLVMLEQAGLMVEKALMGREQYALQMSSKLATEFLARRQEGHKYRVVSVEHTLAVIKEAGLSSDMHGDQSILSRVICSSKKFATKVLKLVKEGKEQSLFVRDLKKGAIKGTEWPSILRDFVLQPEYSTPSPGHETVSVGRNLPRVPKRVFCHSKDTIIKEFLEKHPDCPFHRSVLLRELPQECRTANARDFARNVCVTCTNFRHKMNRLRRAGFFVDSLCSTRWALIWCAVILQGLIP